MTLSMHPPRRLLTLCLLATAAAATAATAAAEDTAAPNAAMRFFSVTLQRDAEGNQALPVTLSLPVGQRAYVQLGGGRSRNRQQGATHRPAFVTGGLGYIGEGWQASLNAAHRRDGSVYRQSDLSLALDWQGEIVNLGLDGSYRHARQQGDVAAPDGQGGSVPVLQRVKGGGLGLHGGARLGDRTQLYAALMRYHYHVATQHNGASGAPGGAVAGLLGDRSLLARTLSTRPSAVNRDEAALSRSLQLGASYRFDRVALSAEYIGDRVLDAPGTVHTALVRAALTPSPRWTVPPALGRTRSTTHGGVNFAAVSASVAW